MQRRKNAVVLHLCNACSSLPATAIFDGGFPIPVLINLFFLRPHFQIGAQIYISKAFAVVPDLVVCEYAWVQYGQKGFSCRV